MSVCEPSVFVRVRQLHRRVDHLLEVLLSRDEVQKLTLQLKGMEFLRGAGARVPRLHRVLAASATANDAPAVTDISVEVTRTCVTVMSGAARNDRLVCLVAVWHQVAVTFT